MKSYLIATTYKFVHLADPEELKPVLLKEMTAKSIKGTIILAHEGINGTFCGLTGDMLSFIDFLRSIPEFSDLHFKESFNDSNPFDKSKVKLRKEIVTMGIPGIDPEKQTGVHLSPAEWNTMLENGDEVVVIDTRNHYEVMLGTFKGAVDPKTINFRDFPEFVEKHLIDKKDKKIAMFCTGGVRCEKSTAYLLNLGFENVYQLDGGILNYLEKIPTEESLWQGECFIFDNRVALDTGLNKVKDGQIDREWKNRCRQQAAKQQ